MIDSSCILFYELIRVSIGVSSALSFIPNCQEWNVLYRLAMKQALIGVCFYGVQRLPKEQIVNLPMHLKLQWLGMAASIQKRNDLMNNRCKELQKRLKDARINSCILKGQGIASIYFDTLCNLRQPGDIDVWVEGGLDSVKLLATQMNQRIKVTEQHADLKFFTDVEVEVHFIPTILRSPFANKCLHKWMKEQEKTQFSNCNGDGLFVPTLEFNMVYLMIHTYRHILGEGVGLRQVMDYYMLLSSEQISTALKLKTMKCFRSLHIENFAAGLMWVMKEVFCLSEDYMLCVPNERHGKFLLNEIVQAGNMGHYDERLVSMKTASKFERYLRINIHTFRLLKYYPQETLFSPIARMWIWAWRKKHGYL